MIDLQEARPDTGRDRALMPLIRALYPYAIGCCSPDNEPFFARVQQELPLTLLRFPSDQTYNGWVVPKLWSVQKASIYRDGVEIFDGTCHPMAVGTYSKSFQGELDWDELQRFLVTKESMPSAHVYHCMWQYRPWSAEWALCVPFETYSKMGPGRYRVDLQTRYEQGAMIVGEYEKRGRSERTIVFNAHTCHPRQVNDDLAGVVVLIRLFQWLQTQDTYYTYRLVLAPEHVGTVFYMRDRSPEDIGRLVAGAFSEMPGTDGPIKIASTFLGNQPIDQAFRNAVRHGAEAYTEVGWREGAGNDETVWEAPGYEVPFVQVSRCLEQFDPYPEYHTSLDTPELMVEARLNEFYAVFQRVVQTLERNAVLRRHFNGLICLSNPQYQLYRERPDPSVVKHLDADAEKWGHLLDSLFRYFDGRTTILEIAEKHDLPFDELYRYLKKFEDKELVTFEFSPIERVPVSAMEPRP
ncbi:MAG: DUF4910 domain-containing protein [Armatimonadetes bacterium]|nr:DUF4910 domain-containing protein [Armatimonadota bacterium]